MPRTLTRSLTRSLMPLIAVALVACGDCGPDNNPNNIPTADVAPDPDAPTSDVGPDGSTTDMPPTQDMGPDMPPLVVCEGVTCDPGFGCVNDVCVVVDSCAAADDLGVLPLNQFITVTGSLITHGVEDLEATCVGATSLRDRVITFEISEDATLEYEVTWIGQFDGVVELRSACGDANAALDCSDVEDRSVTVSPGRYYLVLDQKLGNAGAYSVRLIARERYCTPGVRVCMGNDVELCPDPQAPVTYACAGACLPGGICTGDVCTAPIGVTRGAAGSTATGDGQPYTNLMDFATNMQCRDGANAVATPGYDVLFYAPNLQVGDVITIDAQTGDANINSVIIKGVCSEDGNCARAFRNGEDVDWVVDMAGDYYVIVDKWMATPTPFNYRVTVQ